MHPVYLSFDNFMTDFDDTCMFTGFGCLPGEYHIEGDPDIKLVQYTPWWIIKAVLKEKIDEMDKP